MKVLSAAHWDPEFKPSPEAFDQWRDALSGRATMKPNLVALGLLTPFFAWVWWWPGKAQPAFVAYAAVIMIVVTGFAWAHLRDRQRAEHMLKSEYDAWCAATPASRNRPNLTR